jgi:copper chaperone CopZ
MRTKIALLLTFALASFARAEVSVKLSDVHICCSSCVKGVDKAVAGMTGITAKADEDSESIAITAPDQATAQKVVNALTAAGYFGKSSDPSIKVDASTGASDAMVHSLAVNDVHLCCPKCVTAVKDALKGVSGVSGNNAVKNAKTFQVTGDFKASDVFKALQQAGLTGKAGPAQ